MDPIHTHHISRQYNAELEEIRSRVLQMGGLVEQQIEQALTALVKADVDLGEAVIMDDTKVNQLDVTIDEECQHIIARRQPRAGRRRGRKDRAHGGTLGERRAPEEQLR